MLLFLFGGIAFITLLCLIFKSNDHAQGLKNNPKVRELSNYVAPNKILTPHERKMYHMLKEVIPNNYAIMCQVSFNAFIKCNDIKLRNKFNRNFVDFIIINEEFMPILCIELDDASHDFSEVIKKDEFRDNLLSAALIPTERFKGLPKSKSYLKSRLEAHFSKPKHKKIYKALQYTK